MNHRQVIQKVKKYVTLLKLVFVLVFIPQTMLYATGGTMTGSGTTADPFFVVDYADLKVVGTTTTYTLSAVYRLTGDIDASASQIENGGAGFVPIGNSTTSFTGKFHGAGHVIKNLHINHSGTDYVGLFGNASGGAAPTIDSLGVTNEDMTGRDDVGGVVGSIGGGTIIDNCYATGSVTGRNWIGGVVGVSLGYDTISNCYATGSVIGSDWAGGVVGGIEGGTIDNCYATGNVIGRDSYLGYIGGFVGTSGGTITHCYATGSVTADTSMSVGGFVGYNSSNGARISNCYTTGIVTGYNSVGGFVGTNVAIITNCYATGTVTGVYVASTVRSNIGDYVGGFVGVNAEAITNCYATGSVTGIDGVGGVVGYNQTYGTISNCYWNTQTTGCTLGYGYNENTFSGSGLTTAQMQQSSSFSGWDFTTVWSINSSINNGYPYLASNIPTSVEGVAVVTPKTFSLLQNYPNPFNPTTTIQFSVEKDGKAVVKAFDILGREVATLYDNVARAGHYYTATFSGSRYSSGVYFYIIESNNQRIVKKMLMLK